MAITRFIGVDLAWAEGSGTRKANETGVVALDRSGRVIDAGWTVGVDQTVVWMQRQAVPDGTVAFIDAPLVVDNESGQRPCEHQVGPRYGKWQVSANSTNKRSLRQAGVPLLRILTTSGWAYSSGFDGPPHGGLSVSECYPYTTLVGVPELYAKRPPPGLLTAQRPRYKRKPRVKVTDWRPVRGAQWDDLVLRLGALKDADPSLDLASHDATRSLLSRPDTETEREYKHREDLIDAAIAAWTALLWVSSPRRCQVLGPPPSDGREATIIAPAIAEQRRD